MNSNSDSGYLRDYLDFDIEIRQGEPRGYAVAIRSPAGEAQEEMSFPFDERQLRDKLKDLEIALLRSGGTRRALSTEERTVQDFGRSLFEAVLVGKVGTCYYRSMNQAQQQGKGLRLKLHVQPPNLTVLPWEFLYDPDRDEYLCFSRDTPIVRYTDLRQPISRLTVAPPLRILGMVASPRDLDPLDVEHEKGLMDEAIEDLQADGLVKLTWLEGESWRDLQRAMRRDGPWHIFHFVGHGDFDLTAQEGLIAFVEKGTGRRHLLRSRDLARLLDGHPSLRLVFLNSCEGARGSEGDPFSGTAATLVRRGIPAVVAMQYQITDEAAIEFSSAFYESLADGLPVDAAVTEARVAVSMDSMLEWGTPVLYMRSPDGRLFDISIDTRPSEQPLGVTGQEEVRERQEQAGEEIESRNRLDELYSRARWSHQNQEWQEVVDVFEQIHTIDSAYPDREGLLASAREALEAQELARRVTALYAEGQRRMDAGEWQRALECFEEVQRLEPGYRETEQSLSQVRQELAPPSTVEVPDLAGQVIPQARSMLSETGLTLGARNEASSDTVSKGQIIKQNPEAGTEIKAGGSVSVTVSSGTSTVEVPRLTGLSRDQAKDKLHATGLVLGTVTKAFRENMPEGKILEQYPVAGTEIERGRDVRVTISGPREATTVRVGAATRRDGHAESPDSGEQTRSNKGMIVALTFVVLLGIGGFLLYQILATPQHTSQPQGIVVPDLIGMDVADAKEQVGENFHIYVEGAHVVPGTGACSGISGSHQICDQEPKAGKRKPKGSTISVLRTS